MVLTWHHYVTYDAPKERAPTGDRVLGRTEAGSRVSVDSLRREVDIAGFTESSAMLSFISNCVTVGVIEFADRWLNQGTSSLCDLIGH